MRKDIVVGLAATVTKPLQAPSTSSPILMCLADSLMRAEGATPTRYNSAAKKAFAARRARQSSTSMWPMTPDAPIGLYMPPDAPATPVDGATPTPSPSPVAENITTSPGYNAGTWLLPRIHAAGCTRSCHPAMCAVQDGCAHRSCHATFGVLRAPLPACIPSFASFASAAFACASAACASASADVPCLAPPADGSVGIAPETLPYGIRMIQADSPAALEAAGKVAAAVVYCIIDSGVYQAHVDLKQVNKTGCDPLTVSAGWHASGQAMHCWAVEAALLGW